MTDTAPQKKPQRFGPNIEMETMAEFERVWVVPDTDICAALVYHCDLDEEVNLPPGFDYIYLLRCREFAKIGTSRDVLRRLVTLQTGNPRKLHLDMVLAPCNGEPAAKLESLLHQEFKRFGVRGEWFGCEVADWLLDRA